MRTLLLFGYRIVLIFVLLTFFSFATLDEPVLRSLYVAFSSVQSALASTFSFIFNIFETGDEFQLAREAYFRSIVLLLLAVSLGSIVGLFLGLISGLRPRSVIAGLASSVSYIGVLTPSFLLSMLVLLLFIRYLGPMFGVKFVLLSPDVTTFDPRRIFAPAIVLSVRPMAYMAQITIGALQEVIYSDYIRTAKAKGLFKSTILFRHILRNIWAPSLTSLNSSFYFSLGSLLVVEWLFNWGGMGYWLLESASKRDPELASYLLVFVGVTFLIINTIVKVAIRQLDQRLISTDGAIS